MSDDHVLEAVIVDADGKTSFQALQAALGEGGRPERIVAYAFDLLHLDGENLTKRTLTERKQKLAALLRKSKPGASLRYSEHLPGDGAAMHAQACEHGLEGIISKLASAPYVAGRQKSWVKVKCTLRQEFLIVGYSAAKRGDRALGALYLGYRKDGALRYAGKVGTGFTLNSARALVERFEAIRTAKPVLTRRQAPEMGTAEWSAVRWVEPTTLCEVAFTEWTSDGRIRHPSFQGLREDKEPADVTQEKPVPLSVPSRQDQRHSAAQEKSNTKRREA